MRFPETFSAAPTLVQLRLKLHCNWATSQGFVQIAHGNFHVKPFSVNFCTLFLFVTVSVLNKGL